MNPKILIVITALLAVGCQQSTSPPIKPTKVTATATGTPDKSKIKLYDGKGVVTKINLEIVSVELDHEEIKGVMPKMIMEFYVKEKTELERLKVGDAVNFVLEDDAGAERIIKIEKR
jgi:Cu/Ag efflux protein CusF